MIPKKPSNQTQFDLFRLQLDNIINRNHELYRLAEMIDWSVFCGATIRIIPELYRKALF